MSNRKAIPSHDELTRLILAGESAVSLADRYRVTPSEIVAMAGVKRKLSGAAGNRQYPVPTAAEREEIRRLFALGVTQRELMQRYKTSRYTVREITRELMNPYKLKNDCAKAGRASAIARGYEITQVEPGTKSNLPPKVAPAHAVNTRSFALLVDGGRVTVSHGEGEAHAEEWLDAMIAGRSVKQRGVEDISR